MANQYTDAVHKMILPGRGKDRVTQKAILMAMAWHTENKAGTFFGTHGLFAREANCSREAVKKHLPGLLELGVISIIGQKTTRFGPCNRYRMHLDDVLSLSDQGIEEPGTEDPGYSVPQYQGIEAHDQGIEMPTQGTEYPKNSSLTHPGTRQLNSSTQDSLREDSFAETRETLDPQVASSVFQLCDECGGPTDENGYCPKPFCIKD